MVWLVIPVVRKEEDVTYNINIKSDGKCLEAIKRSIDFNDNFYFIN